MPPLCPVCVDPAFAFAYVGSGGWAALLLTGLVGLCLAEERAAEAPEAARGPLGQRTSPVASVWAELLDPRLCGRGSSDPGL